MAELAIATHTAPLVPGPDVVGHPEATAVMCFCSSYDERPQLRG